MNKKYIMKINEYKLKNIIKRKNLKKLMRTFIIEINNKMT